MMFILAERADTEPIFAVCLSLDYNKSVRQAFSSGEGVNTHMLQELCFIFIFLFADAKCNG